MTYAPPNSTDNCRCAGNMGAAMFCMTGHMLECHYPLDCGQAACGHLGRYGYDQAAIERAEMLSEILLKSLADQDCPICGGAGLIKYMDTELTPEPLREQGFDDEMTVFYRGVCRCVVEKVESSQADKP